MCVNVFSVPGTELQLTKCSKSKSIKNCCFKFWNFFMNLVFRIFMYSYPRRSRQDKEVGISSESLNFVLFIFLGIFFILIKICISTYSRNLACHSYSDRA